MPNQRISEMDEDINPASDDMLVTVDVSDTAESPQGSTKRTSPANLTKALSVMQGDGGSGGQKGLAPAPGAGDAAAGKYLDAMGGYSVPPGTGLTSEQIMDIVGALLVSSGDIVPNYDDAGNFLNFALASNKKSALVVFEFGDGKNASSLEANQIARVPYVPAGTIVRARIVGDASGSAVVDIQKSTADPPSFSSIAASAKPTLSSDVYVDDTTLTGWTTSLSAGYELRAVLESVTTCKQVTVVLEIVKS